MILQQLCQDSDVLLPDMPPPMYNSLPVRWILPLDAQGRLSGPWLPLGDEKRGLPHQVPYVKRSSGVRAILLADSPAYTLGVGDDHRVEEKHQAYRAMVAACLAETGSADVEAVHRFLQVWDPADGQVPEDLKPSDTLVFSVEGRWPVDDPEVRSFWAANAREVKGGAAMGQCLICGQTTEIVDRQPAKIKGLPGGQPSGTDLVSVNAAAFESYGLSAARTSPTCRDCGERYAKTLNALMDREHPKNHLYLGPSVFVFWTKHPTFTGMSGLHNPEPEYVQELLGSYRSGKEMARRDPTPFYATSLTANSSRAVARDWLRTTVGEAQWSLSNWFRRLEMVDAYGRPGSPLGLWPLLQGLYRDPGKEATSQVSGALVRGALQGLPLPEVLLSLIVRRNRAEQEVTYPRAALTQAVLLSHLSPQEQELMSNPDAPVHPPAYHCGRLLAELEQLQTQAIRGINTTLVDRFYGAASSAPASVFGTLLRNAQPHLSLLRRTREGAYLGIQSRLEEILLALDETGGWPPTLSVRDQASFGMGYYCQRARGRAAARERAEARKKADGADPDSGGEDGQD